MDSSVMKLNTLKPAPGSKKERTRVGRGIGSGHGKTGGRGHKGQKSRTGGTVKPGFEGGQMPLQRRVPKHGFTSRKASDMAEVRLHELNKLTVDQVDLAALKKANIINENIRRAKVILSGELKKKVTLVGIPATAGAKKAIEKAGGEVK